MQLDHSLWRARYFVNCAVKRREGLLLVFGHQFERTFELEPEKDYASL